MLKLVDLKDDSAIDVWADLLTPVSVIVSDSKFSSLFSAGKKGEIAKYLLKTYKNEVVEILTILECKPLNGLTLPVFLIKFLTEISENKEIFDFLTSPEQPTESKFSGVVTGDFTGAADTL